MALSFIAGGGYNYGNTGSVVLTVPTGTSLNDTMIMFASVSHGVTNQTVTTPAGWNYITDTGGCLNANSTYWRLYAFWKLASGSEPANYTVSVSGTWCDGDIRTYRGANPTNPINSFAIVSDPSSGSSTAVPALSETFQTGEWYVACLITSTLQYPTVTSPVLGNIDQGTATDSLYAGDYIPSGVPGIESYTFSGDCQGAQAIGLTIVPPLVAVAGLQAQACL